MVALMTSHVILNVHKDVGMHTIEERQGNEALMMCETALENAFLIIAGATVRSTRISLRTVTNLHHAPRLA